MEGIAYANSSLLNARNIVNEEKNPVWSPIVWQVDAYDKQSCDSSVKAQPEARFKTA